MFAGLAVEDDDDDDDDSAAEEQEEMVAPVQPKAHSVYGDIDLDDLQITIDVLRQVAADLTLFRSRPFKELREAIGPLARELTGSGANAGGRRGAGKQRGTRLDGLDPVERLKQMDRDALNHRVLRAERLARLETLQESDSAAGEQQQKLLQMAASGDADSSLNAAQGTSLLPFVPDGPAAAAAEGDALPTRRRSGCTSHSPATSVSRPSKTCTPSTPPSARRALSSTGQSARRSATCTAASRS